MRIFNRPFIRKPRVAMVMCVRNESRFLAANLTYHRSLGIERAYVFLDRCSDGSDKIAASFPWVCATCVDPNDARRFKQVPDLQVLCMDRALQQARDEGFDWLMSADADEFAATSKKIRTASPLPSLLVRISAKVELVRLRPRELMPTNLDPADPFWKQQFFQIDPHYCRRALDLRDQTVKSWRGFAGHTRGKSIVRTRADVQALGAHGWTRFQDVSYPHIPAAVKLKSVDRGYLLHYMIVDWQQWLDKYRKLAHTPATFRSGGPVEFPKQAWKETTPSMTDQQAREYFRDCVATGEEQLCQLVDSGIAERNDLVERTLASADKMENAAIQQIHSWSMPPEFWDNGTSGVTTRGAA